MVLLGRLGDIYGRVKMYNLGFLVFTVASIALAFTPNVGSAGALELIGLRIVQGVGGALLVELLHGHPHRRLPDPGAR